MSYQTDAHLHETFCRQLLEAQFASVHVDASELPPDPLQRSNNEACLCNNRSSAFRFLSSLHRLVLTQEQLQYQPHQSYPIACQWSSSAIACACCCARASRHDLTHIALLALSLPPACISPPTNHFHCLKASTTGKPIIIAGRTHSMWLTSHGSRLVWQAMD